MTNPDIRTETNEARFESFMAALRSRSTDLVELSAIETACHELKSPVGFTECQLILLTQELGQMIVQHQSDEAQIAGLQMLATANPNVRPFLPQFLILREISRYLVKLLRQTQPDGYNLDCAVNILKHMDDFCDDKGACIEILRMCGGALVKAFDVATSEGWEDVASTVETHLGLALCLALIQQPESAFLKRFLPTIRKHERLKGILDTEE
jgi:hypothetical protein